MGHMKTRNLMFAECLFLMKRLPNLYNRPKEDLNKYQFGFIRKSSFEDVKLIHPERESEPISEHIGRSDFFEHDIIIVPLSQIPPVFEQEIQKGDAILVSMSCSNTGEI